MMNSAMANQMKRNIIEIASLEDGKIRLSLSESSGQGPIAFYQETMVAVERIDRLVQEITHYLNRINILRSPDPDLLAELQKSCQLLYHELLSQEIKAKLQTTPLRNLELILDEQLVHIPWELLYDGQRFLCEQFSIGRQVRARGSMAADQASAATPKSRLGMLIIADPTEDLEVAWNEGVQIYREFQRKEDVVTIAFQSGEQVDLDFVKKNIWDYDMVHYAGHAEYDPGDPSLSCWIFSDGRLYAADILKMAGGKRVMPRLIFGNACQSGYTEKWHREGDAAEVTLQGYGLVHAFLMAGVHHYIGTFCDVSDEFGACMGIEFYHHLLKGNTVGESLRRARGSFRQKFGRESLSWINYVHYGHPGDHLISPPKGLAAEEEYREDASIGAYTGHMQAESLRPEPEPEPVAPAVRHAPFFIPQRYRWTGAAIIFLLVLILMTLLLSFPQWRMARNERNASIQGGGGYVEVDPKTRRIEELKGMIYEKLAARKGGNAPVQKLPQPSDPWTSRPVVIAIFDVCDGMAGTLPEWAPEIIRDIRKGLTHSFVEDPRTRVAEREELDKLLEEKDLELSDFSFDDQRDLFGKFLYANVMIFLEGYRSSEGISLCYKVVDTDTGEIDTIDSSLTLARKDNPRDLAGTIYAGARDVIYAKHPLRGRVATVKGNLVILNVGANVGIRKGDIFEVLESVEGGIKGMRIGRIMAVNDMADPDQAICEILEGKGFTERLRVELVGR